MIPQDFNVEEFAKALSDQAGQAFPQDLPPQVQQFVIQVVYEFIQIAGGALNGEADHNYTEDDTVLVCQLVGEWMFHKGIDNYKNGIPEEYWKQILQQIAFAVYEAAKNGVLQNVPKERIIDAAENAVNAAYKGIMEQLVAENKVEKSVDEIMQQSNLHDYVEQTNMEEVSSGQEEKDIKLMTMALFFKNLSPEQVGKMIKLLNEDERRQIGVYMQMHDLEKLVDPGLYVQYLDKFHNFMPKVKLQKKKSTMYGKLDAVFENMARENLEEKIKKERKNVKNFLLRVYDGKIGEEGIFSLDLTNSIVDYMVQKAN